MRRTQHADALAERYGHLLGKLRRKGGKHAHEAPQDVQNAPFAGWYETTFVINPMEFVPDGRPARIVSIPITGKGSAQYLGRSTVHLRQVVDFTQVPPRGEASLVFEAIDEAEVYASGEMRFTTPDRDGQSAYAGALLINGGKGKYRTARGVIAVTGTMDRVRGIGTFSFCGTLSFIGPRLLTDRENIPVVSRDRSP